MTVPRFVDYQSPRHAFTSIPFIQTTTTTIGRSFLFYLEGPPFLLFPIHFFFFPFSYFPLVPFVLILQISPNIAFSPFLPHTLYSIVSYHIGFFLLVLMIRFSVKKQGDFLFYNGNYTILQGIYDGVTDHHQHS